MSANAVIAAVLAVVLCAAALVLGWVAFAAARDRLPRQHWAGVRTVWSLAADDSWYAAQRASAPATRSTAWAFGIAGLLEAVAALEPDWMPLAVVAAIPLAACALGVLYSWLGWKAARIAVSALERENRR
ncbi:SdpI family protein [Actinomyces timonensis]|uniref:SdpI family protein n=1 Tax=Actinomyces timonensis TaxID=1288391 RepID=UPI0002EA63EF|nr:SdpI family protein [Actinomyces timonensis]